MADRIEVFDCLIPAGTAIAAPVVIPLTFMEGEVLGGQMVIPDGCAGLVGFQLAYGGQNVIPFQAASFLRGNDEVYPFEIGTLPTGAQFQLIGYNLDVYDHTIQVRLNVDETGRQLPSPVIPLTLNDQSGTADLSGELTQQQVEDQGMSTPADIESEVTP